MQQKQDVSQLILQAINETLRVATHQVEKHRPISNINADGIYAQLVRDKEAVSVSTESTADTIALDMLNQVDMWMRGYGALSQNEMHHKVRACLERISELDDKANPGTSRA